MTKNHRWSLFIGFLTTFVVSLVCFIYLNQQKQNRSEEEPQSWLQSLEIMDRRYNDLQFKWMQKKTVTAPVVLVAVDENSLREIGRWPWDREIMAQLTERLFSLGIKTLGMDIIEAESDRKFPENDDKMASVVSRYQDQLVLGAYSEDRLEIAPYKDYCINEAFLLSGGDSIAKINPTLVVDDMTDNFDDLPWGDLFKNIFKTVQAHSETDYLAQLNKTTVKQLNSFQKNYLRAKKIRDVFEYCNAWLTENDSIFFQNTEVLQAQYEALFSQRTEWQKLNVADKLKLFKQSVPRFPTPQYGEWQGNISSLQNASKYTGSFVANLDSDGYVRRYPLFYRSGSRIGTSFIPSLALQTYLIGMGYRTEAKIEMVQGKKTITSFQIINPKVDPEEIVHQLPVDSNGRLLLNYYGPSFTVPMVSAKDLFSDDEKISVMTQDGGVGHDQIRLKVERFNKKDFFKDKMAVLGVTAVGLYDLRNTPVAVNYPGPEIHLTMIANLFDGEFLRILSNETFWLPLSLAIFGILLTTLLSWLGALGSIASFFMAMGMSLVFDHFLFSRFQILYSSFFIVMEIISVHFFIFVYKFFAEERKRGELKKTFSKYVSPAVVDELLKNDENIKLGGRKQEMTVFFSDVRGFTEFSEKMDPEELSHFLNEYLTPMTEMVFNNKGTLDKYMGDGLMAFFGAPIAYEEHAYYACKCALQSLQELNRLQVEFAKRGWPSIDIGIGINTGFMSVGNMGSKIVQSYTVIGDAVNLASRLEGTTKEYGAKILISEYTYEMVKNRFVFREVDRVRVKGKKEPVRAFELISEVDSEQSVVWLHRYRDAYNSYLAKNFLEAYQKFVDLEKQYPDDKLVRIYKNRCENFINNPPEETWDGVYERKTK